MLSYYLSYSRYDIGLALEFVTIHPVSDYSPGISSMSEDRFAAQHVSQHEDLSGKLPDAWRDFNHRYIPVYLANRPEKNKIAAGLACGMLWTLAKGMIKGSIVLSPDGTGRYRVAEIVGDYEYVEGEVLPHRRAVRWLPQVIERSEMSESLRNSLGSTGTVVTISKPAFIAEIEGFLSGVAASPLVSTDSSIEDPIAFAMERHLEDFLVENWANTDLGIIALEDDQRIRRALAMTRVIDFYRYEISFKLVR